MDSNSIMTLLLPWFPIILAVGVGGKMLGRDRGLVLGFSCALFWVALVQASGGAVIWGDPWCVVTLVAGAVAIAAMGRWSGEVSVEGAGPSRPVLGLGMPNPSPGLGGVTPDVEVEGSPPRHHDLEELSAAITEFDDWLDKHRGVRDPWPKFDEFIRGMLHRCCQAMHTRPYRLSSEGEELVPLGERDLLTEGGRMSARRGIVGHVVTTGRSYLEGDATQGELVEKLARKSSGTIVWCFAIRQGTRRLGVVTVGQLAREPRGNSPLWGLVEQLVCQFWCRLLETRQNLSASEEDPASGLPTREAFLRSAEQSLRESYEQSEPVAVVIVALEGLRDLNDAGRWEVADELVRGVGDSLRRKVRIDDRLGRFDGSRFVLLLRRVDSELASLIVSQIMSRVAAVCGDTERWRAEVTVRGGVVGSGTEEPDLQTLVSRALIECRRARIEGVSLGSDLHSAPPIAEATR